MASYTVRQTKIQKIREAMVKPQAPIVISKNKLDLYALQLKKEQLKFKIAALLSFFLATTLAWVVLRG